MNLQVSLDLINQILGYLGTKPYGEVYQLVIGINTECQPQLPPPPAPEADPSATDPSVVTDVTPTPVQ
jgi:hypothetical protein